MSIARSKMIEVSRGIFSWSRIPNFVILIFLLYTHLAKKENKGILRVFISSMELTKHITFNLKHMMDDISV